MRFFISLNFFFYLFLGISNAYADPIKNGNSNFNVKILNSELEIFSYKPNCKIKSILFVLHGLDRNADDYRDNAIILGDKLCALIIAPRFDKSRFPNSNYQLGGSGHTGEYIIQLADWVKQQENRELPYSLIGHSAGGQFLSRLAAFTPNNAKRIVITNPSTYVFASFEIDTPYGFKGMYDQNSIENEMKRYLKSPITIFIGIEDVGEKNLSKDVQAMAQGSNRYERGINAFKSAQSLAKSRGWTFNWRLVQKSGTGHSSKKMFSSDEAIKALAP